LQWVKKHGKVVEDIQGKEQTHESKNEQTPQSRARGNRSDSKGEVCAFAFTRLNLFSARLKAAQKESVVF